MPEVRDSSHTNSDLRPVPKVERRWSWIDYTALWMGMAHNVPTWILAGGLISMGMSWSLALLAIPLGNLIVLVPILLNSHAGAKYGVPFVMLARASLGVRGAYLASIIRGAAAIGWFGIQVHLGGRALALLLQEVLPGLSGDNVMVLGQGLFHWFTFAAFLALNLMVLKDGMNALKRFEWIAGPAVLVLTLFLCMATVQAAGGLGPVLESSKGGSSPDTFVRGLMAVIGFWATLSLNASDFSRFARSQRDQTLGQAVGLPAAMTLFSLIGILTASAGAVVFGKLLWDPIEMVKLVASPWIAAVALVVVILATLAVNVPANLVSAAYAVSSLSPRRISMWYGALITSAIATAITPWRLLANPGVYIDGWLGTCSMLLAPIAGIMIADYWLVRGKRLQLDDLYSGRGRYKYVYGYNVKGLGVAAVALAVAMAMRLSQPGTVIGDMSWVTGFLTALVLYRAVHPRIKYKAKPKEPRAEVLEPEPVAEAAAPA